MPASATACPSLLHPQPWVQCSLARTAPGRIVPKFPYRARPPALVLTCTAGCCDPVWHGLPSVVAFACVGRCYNLTQAGLLLTSAPGNIDEFYGPAWLDSSQPLPSSHANQWYCSPIKISPQIPYGIHPQIQFSNFPMDAVAQLEVAYPLPLHLQAGTAASPRQACLPAPVLHVLAGNR